MRAASARAATPGMRLGGLRGMSDTTRRILIIAVGLTGSVLLAATIIWGMSRMGPRTVPLIEADGRPFRVRPEGLPLTPPAPAAQPGRGDQARLLPAPEAPRVDALRQQMAPPAPTPAPAAAPQATAVPAAAPPPLARNGAPRAGAAPAAAPRQGQVNPPAAAPGPAEAARTAAAPNVGLNAAPTAGSRQAQAPASPPAAAGRAAVQLSAAATEEAARAEWERLRRRAPELAGMTPRITRLEREGREPLWRLRVGGLADPAAARALCDQLRGKGAACNPV